MRLNKYIAEAGVCSRRKADELIAAGKVRVNGVVVRTLGYDAPEGARVEADGREVRPQMHKVYIALNKPKDCITTTADERGRPTVMPLVADAGEGLFPVGRLDGATTGLLFFTNDGDFAYRLTHPKHELEKTYRARIGGAVSKEKLDKLRNGVRIENYTTAPAGVELLRQGERSSLVEIRIHEGKNRQIRRMFAAVGCRVLELERTQIGAVCLGGLKPGHWRKLTRREIDALMQ
ncbi:MAG: rRNA pseudouridine synthase [Clostridiales bacterium]|nr:rRNA pseudouridine synthase [Clostridiales bacterium]